MIRRSPPLILLSVVLLLWTGSRLTIAFAGSLFQRPVAPLPGGAAPFVHYPDAFARIHDQPAHQLVSTDPLAAPGLLAPVTTVRLAVRPIRHDPRHRVSMPSSPLALPPMPAERQPILGPATYQPTPAPRRSQLRSLMLAFHSRTALASGAPAVAADGRLAMMDNGLLPRLRDRSASVVNRWSGGAWLALRHGSYGSRLPSLGSVAMLGGSQGGARLARTIDRGQGGDIYVRLTTTGQSMDGAEGAVGLSWQPARAIPVRLAVERRHGIMGGESRSAFAAMASGGVSDLPLPDGWRLDGYGAAGVVGARRRDAFGEGSVRITRPLAALANIRLSAGAGVWGAAQPGVSRLDGGPGLDVRLGQAAPRLSIDWRQRLAGQAAPGSGVAVTLATDF